MPWQMLRHATNASIMCAFYTCLKHCIIPLWQITHGHMQTLPTNTIFGRMHATLLWRNVEGESSLALRAEK